MTSELTTALIAGGFALIGAIAGVVLNARFGYSAERRRIEAEDERRWLADRKNAYARYLGMCTSMHQEIDRIAVFLRYDTDSASLPADDERHLSDALGEFLEAWEKELSPLLGEVALIASPKVVDLSDRVSGALLALTAPIETRDTFTSYYPAWFQAQDLIHVMRDEMRAEIGLAPVGEVFPVGLRADGSWPWLEDRPARESYIQNHSSRQE